MLSNMQFLILLALQLATIAPARIRGHLRTRRRRAARSAAARKAAATRARNRAALVR